MVEGQHPEGKGHPSEVEGQHPRVNGQTPHAKGRRSKVEEHRPEADKPSGSRGRKLAKAAKRKLKGAASLPMRESMPGFKDDKYPRGTQGIINDPKNWADQR